MRQRRALANHDLRLYQEGDFRLRVNGSRTRWSRRLRQPPKRTLVTVAVLCKWCPDPADLEVGGDGSISLERAQWSVSEYDRVAIEVAVTLGHETDGVVAVTAGSTPVASSMAQKAILSRGPDALYVVADDRLEEADARQTAYALAGALDKIGGVELVVCGAGSVDYYAQQVGAQVAVRLGWPCLDEIAEVVREDGCWRLGRRLGDEIVTLELPGPAVLSVTADAATPHIPGMRDILAASKRPATTCSLDDLDPAATVDRSARTVSTVGWRAAVRRQVLFEGPPAETARQLAQALRQEGLV